MPCPECRGQGCEVCGGRGRLEVRRCPGRAVPRVAWAICGYAARLESGILPVAGGWEDQSVSWAEAVNFVLAEKAAYDEVKWDHGRKQK